jgi:diacylglycerol kinase family enzyme
MFPPHTRSTRRITVILNASAGAATPPDLPEVLVDAFAAAGFDAHIAEAHTTSDMTAAIEAACKARPEIIVAAGGDGTISAVAQAAIDAGLTLGVLPVGTLNHFAKDLNIPLTIDAAVQTICAGHTVAVDVGEVDGRIFLNNSSLGLYPRIVRHRDGQQRKYGRSKWLALLVASLTVLAVMPLFRFRIRVDGQEETFSTSLILIGNNDYIVEGWHFGERKRLDAGHLSLHVPHARGRLGLMWFALRALIGGLREDSGFDVRAARNIVIDSRHPHMQVAIDGEVTVMPMPLTYRIRPGALRVIAPLATKT